MFTCVKPSTRISSAAYCCHCGYSDSIARTSSLRTSIKSLTLAQVIHHWCWTEPKTFFLNRLTVCQPIHSDSIDFSHSSAPKTQKDRKIGISHWKTLLSDLMTWTATCSIAWQKTIVAYKLCTCGRKRISRLTCENDSNLLCAHAKVVKIDCYYFSHDFRRKVSDFRFSFFFLFIHFLFLINCRLSR